ncbi:MAG: restriction endonuclease subunit S [Bacteroidales bacterium]|nr:restriction endonuclease subunit S [Bacteroidales bacterium]
MRSQQIEKSNSYSFDCEAVLTAGDGVGTGKVFHYINGKFEVHQRVYLINNFSQNLLGKYFYWIFSNNFYDRVHSMTAKSSVDSVRKEMIGDMLIPIPSISEQERIAEALSDVDALIAELDKLIAKKRLIKQGAMQQLLTGHTRLPGFSNPWINTSISDAFDFGNGYTPSTKVEKYWNGGTLPWFRVEDIKLHGHILDDSIQHVTPLAIKTSLFPAGCFILSTSATIGEYAWLQCEALANQRFIFLIPKTESPILSDFFFHVLSILSEWCQANSDTGSSFPTVNMSLFKKYNIWHPSTIQEQQAIAAILSDMDSEISSLEQKKSKYEKIKQGMMQQLLTGRIRLI